MPCYGCTGIDCRYEVAERIQGLFLTKAAVGHVVVYTARNLPTSALVDMSNCGKQSIYRSDTSYYGPLTAAIYRNTEGGASKHTTMQHAGRTIVRCAAQRTAVASRSEDAFIYLRPVAVSGAKTGVRSPTRRSLATSGRQSCSSTK